MIKYKFLLEMRKSNKLSQAFLAEKLNISRQTYMEIEKGAKELTISQAQKIADIFNMSLPDFLSGEKTSNIKVSLDKGVYKKIHL